ncbi:MAG: hypothetical protein RIS47_1851 [Bacteroidota bacterium]|jgi:hypothetical protein
MRKIVLVMLIAMAFVPSLKAQFDVAINPIDLLFTKLVISAEIPVNEGFGLEGDFSYNWKFLDVEGIDVLGLTAMGKYYFNPEVGIDKFYIGAYARYQQFKSTETSETYNRGCLGFLVGYKWVSSRKIIFDSAVGVGRQLLAPTVVEGDDLGPLNFDILLKLSVGYRF